VSDLNRRINALANRMLEDLERRFGVLFEDPEDSYEEGGVSVFPTRYTVSKGEDGVTILVEVPGLSHEDIALDLEEGVLRVQGGRRQSASHLISINRSFRVGITVRPEDITALAKDGLLTITVKRSPCCGPNGNHIPVNGK